MDEKQSLRRAWVTLLTRESYLAGAILLAHSLFKNRSEYPLLILYTPSFPAHLLGTLAQEAALSNAVLEPVEPLMPISKDEMTLIASRFEDTWTKLRVFEMIAWDRLIFLDADMLVLRNMDELFDMQLPPGGLAANHACVCNLDRDQWADPDWTEQNCAFTGSVHPAALFNPPVVPALDDAKGKPTHRLLNSGLFIFEPTPELWDDMVGFMRQRTELLKTMKFPDQDFLAEFFKGRWKSVGWQYNALKTWRYWHTDMWRDEEVRNLHYIVDKPWTRRIGSDGVAGYLGHDGETHRWWWREFESWKSERKGETEILSMMEKHVARVDSDEGSEESS
ncbi:glycosyl transferase family 8 [Phlyctema vagabunda]|uniref:Glycosyl transferase family 8 n=1 Tax=Phlyctema vagabunda TaxID=108571 RepID=A0ABR4PUX1_9HELO